MITKLNTSPTGAAQTGLGMGTILLIAAGLAAIGYYFYSKDKKKEDAH